MKTIEEIKDAYNREEYKTKLDFMSSSNKVKEGYVFNEDKSVRWNRERVIAHNEAVDEAIAKRRADQNRLDTQLSNDILDALKYEYDFKHEQAQEIYSYAYREHHDNMNTFFYHLDEIAQMVSKVLKV